MLEQTTSGKVAIVTGSFSGIGAAIVGELSSRGASTVVSYPFHALKGESDALVLSRPSPSIAVRWNMSRFETPEKLAKAALAKWNRIDIPVYCVVLAVNKPLEDQTLEDWDLLLNVNGRVGESSTLRTSSRGPPQSRTIYAGTKEMVNAFTKYGCTVNSVSPGLAMTEDFAAAGKQQMKILQPIIDQTPV
ncbi:hypothetical protein BDV11DRAFT_206107 [Aspergillus similis]